MKVTSGFNICEYYRNFIIRKYS